MTGLSLIHNSALLVGSAPDAQVLSTADIPRSICLIAINNAWRLRSDFHMHVCPNDFPDTNKPPATYRIQRAQNRHYTPGLRRAGGTLFCGATMAFCAGYYALSVRSERIMGFVGCNMVYDGAETHFYGKGQPDPVKVDMATYASIKNLKAKAARLFLYGLLQDTLMLNVLPHPKGQLLMPTTVAAGDITSRYQSLMRDVRLHKCLVKAANLLMKEREFPADRHALNLTPISKNPDLMHFIDRINDDWQALGAEAIKITDQHLH